MSKNRFDAHQLGVEAYLYLYPLVTMEVTRRQMTNVEAGKMPGRAPMGQFALIPAFPTADFKAVVRPNFDTLYSCAWLDLSGGPVIVSLPDTAGRYYVYPIYDMWTDAFAAPGWRTTGTGEQHYALIPPGWSGPLPEEVSTLAAPTPTVWIIARTQTGSERSCCWLPSGSQVFEQEIDLRLLKDHCHLPAEAVCQVNVTCYVIQETPFQYAIRTCPPPPA